MITYKRRPFIQKLVTIPIVGNLFGWRNLLSSEAPDFRAVDFIRLVNSLEVTHKCKGKNLKTLGLLFEDPLSKKFMACRNSDRFGFGLDFTARLEFDREDAVLPGWRTRVYLNDDGADYVIAVLRSARDAFVRSLYVSDSSGVVFRGRVASDYSLPEVVKSRSDLNVSLRPVSIFHANDGLRVGRVLSQRIGMLYVLPQGGVMCVSPAPSCRGNCRNSSQCFCYDCASQNCGWCCFPDCTSCFLAGQGQHCACCT